MRLIKPITIYINDTDYRIDAELARKYIPSDYITEDVKTYTSIKDAFIDMFATDEKYRIEIINDENVKRICVTGISALYENALHPTMDHEQVSRTIERFNNEPENIRRVIADHLYDDLGHSIGRGKTYTHIYSNLFHKIRGSNSVAAKKMVYGSNDPDEVDNVVEIITGNYNVTQALLNAMNNNNAARFLTVLAQDYQFVHRHRIKSLSATQIKDTFSTWIMNLYVIYRSVIHNDKEFVHFMCTVKDTYPKEWRRYINDPLTITSNDDPVIFAIIEPAHKSMVESTMKEALANTTPQEVKSHILKHVTNVKEVIHICDIMTTEKIIKDSMFWVFLNKGLWHSNH